MNKDEAAAVLGDASRAYFKSNCEACKGSGRLTIMQRVGTRITKYRECPHCGGSGEAHMPSPKDILRAAVILASEAI